VAAALNAPESQQNDLILMWCVRISVSHVTQLHQIRSTRAYALAGEMGDITDEIDMMHME
jgi:hypothetical protein